MSVLSPGSRAGRGGGTGCRVQGAGVSATCDCGYGGWKSNGNNAIKILLFLHLFACKFSYCLDMGGQRGVRERGGSSKECRVGGAAATSLATHSRDLFDHNLIQLAHYFISSSPDLPLPLPLPHPPRRSQNLCNLFTVL